MEHYKKKFLIIFTATVLIGLVVFGVLFAAGSSVGSNISADALALKQNTVLLYIDPETGEENELHVLNQSESRVWADLEDIPDNLQKAFIAIEDERFYEHSGMDLRRTIKATLTWIGDKITFKKGGATLGGSTITQQLIKNVTGKREQTVFRKVGEIFSALALEREMEKDQILELYLNCIYLSQGCSGVQTAANLYFDKDVSELTLAECASIAGITKYPSLYDPFVNPENNKKRQETVLGKMFELGYISEADYDKAKAEELKFANSEEDIKEREATTGTTSYFADHVIREVMQDLQKKGYSKTLAENMLYSGGLKIYTTCNPYIQRAMEEYYSKESNFPAGGAQSAMAVVDVQTGQIAGLVGGIGEKEASLTLNRATSPRQPGSSIKPIAVYAPAIENGIINPASIYIDQAKSYGDWTPRNYDYSYRGAVDVRSAVRSSLNTIPVEILSKLGAETSFKFLKDKLGITTLVESRKIDGTIYSDIGYSQLALGGLTDGVTALEMAAAFATFANNGVYTKPYIYTEVIDREGNVILKNEKKTWKAMKPSTAFIMSRMLQEVVTSGTGRGAGLYSGVFTGGKTGTTSDNKDRWFVGFTPYYAGAVWYGYDIPKEIPTTYNPCMSAFRAVMEPAHKHIKETRSITRPSDVVSVEYCPETGLLPGENCEKDTYYFVKGNTPGGECTEEHPPEEGEEGIEGEEGEEGEEGAEGTEGEVQGPEPTDSGAESDDSYQSGETNSEPATSTAPETLVE